jgi:hypothetical protein
MYWPEEWSDAGWLWSPYEDYLSFNCLGCYFGVRLGWFCVFSVFLNALVWGDKSINGFSE